MLLYHFFKGAQYKCKRRSELMTDITKENSFCLIYLLQRFGTFSFFLPGQHLIYLKGNAFANQLTKLMIGAIKLPVWVKRRKKNGIGCIAARCTYWYINKSRCCFIPGAFRQIFLCLFYTSYNYFITAVSLAKLGGNVCWVCHIDISR